MQPRRPSSVVSRVLTSNTERGFAPLRTQRWDSWTTPPSVISASPMVAIATAARFLLPHPLPRTSSHFLLPRFLPLLSTPHRPPRALSPHLLPRPPTVSVRPIQVPPIRPGRPISRLQDLARRFRTSPCPMALASCLDVYASASTAPLAARWLLPRSISALRAFTVFAFASRALRSPMSRSKSTCPAVLPRMLLQVRRRRAMVCPSGVASSRPLQIPTPRKSQVCLVVAAAWGHIAGPACAVQMLASASRRLTLIHPISFLPLCSPTQSRVRRCQALPVSPLPIWRCYNSLTIHSCVSTTSSTFPAFAASPSTRRGTRLIGGRAQTRS